MVAHERLLPDHTVCDDPLRFEGNQRLSVPQIYEIDLADDLSALQAVRQVLDEIAACGKETMGEEWVNAAQTRLGLNVRSTAVRLAFNRDLVPDAEGVVADTLLALGESAHGKPLSALPPLPDSAKNWLAAWKERSNDAWG